MAKKLFLKKDSFTNRGYYESGALCWETPYKDGKKHGLYNHYFESGILSGEILFVNGKEYGIMELHNEDGTRIL
jgi:antitoxin component YwqK of YwqJK toxin-antitoxin module